MSDLKRNEYYSATFYGLSGREIKTQWVVDIDRKYGNVFTVELANKFLDMANEKYKQMFWKDVDFHKVKYYMSDYWIDEDNVLDDGVSHPTTRIVDKVGVYDKRKNRLTIYKDGYPIYMNDDGKICRDTVAMMDSGIGWIS